MLMMCIPSAGHHLLLCFVVPVPCPTAVLALCVPPLVFVSPRHMFCVASGCGTLHAVISPLGVRFVSGCDTLHEFRRAGRNHRPSFFMTIFFS